MKGRTASYVSERIAKARRIPGAPALPDQDKWERERT